MTSSWLTALSRYSAFFVLAVVAVLIEVGAAGTELLFPAAIFVAFYLGVAYSWEAGLFWGLAAGLAADVVLGRNGGALLILPPVLCLADQWRRLGDRTSLALQALLATALCSAYNAATLVVENFSWWPLAVRVSFRDVLWGILPSALFAAPIFIGLMLGADAAADQLDFPRYRRAPPRQSRGRAGGAVPTAAQGGRRRG